MVRRARNDRPNVRSRLRSFVFREPADAVHLLAVVVAGAYVYYLDLGAYELVTWDEAYYGNVARFVLDGSALVPRYYSFFGPVSVEPYLEKPPLAFWFQAASMAVLGDDPLGARVHSATFAILTGALVYLFGRRIATRRAGLFAAVILLTTPYLYAGNNAGRSGGVETTFLFFGTAFVFLLWRVAVEDRADLALPAFLAGVGAVMVKGLGAGIFLLVAAPLAFAGRRTLLRARALRAAAVAAAIGALWPLYAWLRYGETFVQRHVIQQVFARATGSSFVDASGTLFPFMRWPYFRTLPTLYDPWLYLLVPAAVVAIARGLAPDAERSDRTTWLLLPWWVAVVLGFFAFTGNHPWYVLPAFVGGALAIGVVLDDASRGRLPALVAAIAGFDLALAFSHRANVGSPLALARRGGLGTIELPDGLPFLAALLGGGVLVVGRGLLARAAADRPLLPIAVPDGPRSRAAFAACVAVLFVVGIAAHPAIPGNDWDRNQHRLGAAVDRTVPPDGVVHLQPAATNDSAYHAFAFRADRRLEPATIAALNRNASMRYALVTNDSRQRLDRERDVLATATTPTGTDVALVALADGDGSTAAHSRPSGSPKGWSSGSASAYSATHGGSARSFDHAKRCRFSLA